MYNQDGRHQHGVSLEERCSNMREQLENISSRYDRASSDLERERLLREELVDERVAAIKAEMERKYQAQLEAARAEAKAEAAREYAEKEEDLKQERERLDLRAKELSQMEDKVYKAAEARVQDMGRAFTDRITNETSSALAQFQDHMGEMLSSFEEAMKGMVARDDQKVSRSMERYRESASKVRNDMMGFLEKKMDKICADSQSKRKQLSFFTRKMFGVNSEQVRFDEQERKTIYDRLCENDLLTDEQRKQFRQLLDRDRAYRAEREAERKEKSEGAGHGRNPLPESMAKLPDIDIWPAACLGHEDEYHILGRIPTTKVYPAKARFYCQTQNRIVAVRKDDPTRTPIADPMEETVLSKSYFSNELASVAEVGKYVGHRPFYRQLQQWARDGWEVSRSTMNDVHVSVVSSLEELYQLHREYVLKSLFLAADGCPMKVVEVGKRKCKMKYIIVYRDVVTGIPLFVYDVGTPGNGRSAETIQSHLAPWSGIALMCDACQSYDWLKKVGVILCRCSAHGRREIERALKENRYVASYGIAFFQIIYGVDDQIKSKGLTGEAKTAYRNDHARLAWENLLAWCAITVHDAPEGSQLRKACNYIIRHYKELTAYLDLSVMPLDNNATESALRDMVMGKQNYLFCQNEQSCHYAAVMYSFFGTCKVLKINPEKWLTDVLNRLPHTPKEKLHELLPQVWIETHPEAQIK